MSVFLNVRHFNALPLGEAIRDGGVAGELVVESPVRVPGFYSNSGISVRIVKAPSEGMLND